MSDAPTVRLLAVAVLSVPVSPPSPDIALILLSISTQAGQRFSCLEGQLCSITIRGNGLVPSIPLTLLPPSLPCGRDVTPFPVMSPAMSMESVSGPTSFLFSSLTYDIGPLRSLQVGTHTHMCSAYVCRCALSLSLSLPPMPCHVWIAVDASRREWQCPRVPNMSVWR